MAEPDANGVAHARRVKKHELAGVGCLIQALGVVALFLFPVGTLLGIILLVFGHLKSSYWVCGNCGNRIADAGVRMCPVCRADLSPPPLPSTPVC